MPRSIEAMRARYGEAYVWGVMAMAMASTIAAVLSATIINVAIPDIMGVFGIDQVRAQWLAAGYLACMAVTMVLVDWATRAVGQAWVMGGSAAAFLVFSIVGGTAQSIEVLSLSRIVQGAASGFMQPLSMIAVMQVFPPERRGTAMGIYGIGAVLAPGIGPFFGGVLMEAFDWRYVFYVGAPLSVASLVLTVLFMPQPSEARPRTPFDWPGLALMLVFFGCLFTALTDGAREGWHDVTVVARFGLGTVSLLAFIAWEARAAAPMFNVRLFRYPGFLGAALVSLVLGGGLFGSTYVLPLFVQIVQGLTPTLSGAILLAGGIAMLVLTPLTGRLADRFDPGLLVGIGLALFAISFWLMSGAELRTGVVTLALWLMVSRIGMSLIFPALSAGGTRAVPPSALAQAASGLNMLRQFGGALGVNLLAVVIDTRTRTHAESMAAAQLPGYGPTERYLEHIESLASRSVLTAPEQESVALFHLAETLQAQAFSFAIGDAFAVGTLAFVGSLLGAAMMNSSVRRAFGVIIGRSKGASASPLRA